MNLYKGGELTLRDAKRIDELQYPVQNKFNDYIGELIDVNKLSGIDLLLAATCRNTVSSDVYDVLCRIELLEETLAGNEAIIEISSEYCVSDLVKQVVQKYIKYGVEFKEIIKPKSKLFFVILNIIKSLYLIINSWFWTRIFQVKKTPVRDVTYVDTFLFIDSINKEGVFSERYYTGHEKYLSEKVVLSEWYSPTLVNIRHPNEFIKICRSLRQTKTNFLLQESWLTLGDYMFALFWSILLPFRLNKYPLYKGYDVSKIFKKLVCEDIGSPALMKALCQYRFIRRLSKENVKIKRAINWAENQNIDRALNIGFKKYYPNTKVYGYQGFPILKYYACAQPTCYELSAGTLPDVLGVVCPTCIDQRKSICNELEVKLFPAFRFAYLFNVKDTRPKDVKIILIALPGFDIDESRRILHDYLVISKRLNERIKVIVKQHPGYTIEQFSTLVPEFTAPEFEYTDKNFSEILGSISVLITSASSVCLEAVAVGVPALIHGNRFGVTMNSIPSNVPDDLWGVYYTHDELLILITEFLDKKERHSIVPELFCPVTKIRAGSLFGFN